MHPFRDDRRIRLAAASVALTALLLSAGRDARAEEAACRERYLHACPAAGPIGPERPNYVVVARVPGPPEFEGQHDDDYELGFQVSGRIQPTRHVPLYFVYSQRSFDIFTCCSTPIHWNVYHPEVYLDFELNPLALDPARQRAWGFRGGRVGLDHQSNGLSNEAGLSRVWNREYVELKFALGQWPGAAALDFTRPTPHVVQVGQREREFLVVRWKGWASQTHGPDGLEMADYLGRTQVALQLTTDAQQLRLTVRRGGQPRTFTAEVDYAFAPPAALQANFMVLLRYFSGVGETLQDYNQPHTRWLFGIMFTR